MRVFLLSPARCDGERARLLLSERASFPLARALRGSEGAPIGEAFRFMSGLYFRGKLAYASAFAKPPRDTSGALVITTDRGLLPADAHVTVADLRAMSQVPVDLREPRYVEPLARDLSALASRIDAPCSIVLLGSLATGKYARIVLDVLGDRACFPNALRGRGDMQRGSILLRSAREGRELEYEPLASLRIPAR